MDELHKRLHPSSWSRPKGYANGVIASGQTIFWADRLGGTRNRCLSQTILLTKRDHLENIVAILAEAGAGPEHLVRLTWFVTDKAEYVTRLREVGAAYIRVLGKNFPAMSLIQVVALVEDRAKVEISDSGPSISSSQRPSDELLTATSTFRVAGYRAYMEVCLGAC